MLIYGVFLLLVSLLISVFVSYSSMVTGQTSYKTEGYIKDASGAPIAGAYLVFNNASIPLIETNQQGYYSVYTPAGTYRLDVFPPYDSRFINYNETYRVDKSGAKNFTLYTGYKVSGYVVNASGSPMVGAAVLLHFNSSHIYGSGFFTDQEGYYYVNAPAGTYTIDAHPQTAYNSHYQGECTYFQTYKESGFKITSDLTRNITVDSTYPTTTPTPQPTTTTTPEPQETPKPTTTAITTPTPTKETTITQTPIPTITPQQTPNTSPTPNPSTDAVSLSTQPTPTTTSIDTTAPIIIVAIIILAGLAGLLFYRRKAK